jgi:hypothetical protein
LTLAQRKVVCATKSLVAFSGEFRLTPELNFIVIETFSSKFKNIDEPT